jgi:hypothetical protein
LQEGRNVVHSERVQFLPEDVYSFLGQQVGVRSNASRLLEYLRSLYGRFYVGADDASGKPSTQRDGRGQVITIVDDLEGCNEMWFEDGFYRYCLSRAGSHSRLSSEELQAPHSRHSYVLEIHDPLTFVGSATLRTVSLLLNDYQLFHAGAVSCRGQGIILPADPGMGKTTLVVKLAMLGCGFLSDEIACLHATSGLLEPFPRRVNIREPSQELLGLALQRGASPHPVPSDAWEWSLDIEDIQPGSLASACQPRYVVFLRGFADQARLDRLASSNALLDLLPCTVGPVEDAARLAFQLAGLLKGMECYQLVVGDLEESAALVMALAEGAGDGEGRSGDDP